VTRSATVEASPGARRRFRPRSIGVLSTPDLVGLLVSCLVVVVAYSPILFEGRSLSASAKTYSTNGREPFPGQPAGDFSNDFRPDQGASSWALEPWAEVTSRAYANGDLPLWNPYQGAGSPHAANMQSAVFDPLLLAVNLHPTPLTWDLSILGTFVLGAAAAFLFGRVLGLDVVPSVATSAAFSLSGWFFLYSNNGFSRSYAYLPVLFLLVELTLRSRRLLPVFGLSVAVAGNIYVGMPEASLLVIGSASTYAVARLVQTRERTPFRVSILRLGGAGLLGVMLAAPLALLFLEYEPFSFNVHKPDFAMGSGTDPQWGLLNWLVPFFAEFRSSGGASAVRNWVGVAVGVSALAAMSGRAETKRLHTWLFVALAGTLLLKVYESRIPGWIERLPVVELIIFPTFAPVVVSFAFAVLAGIGVQVVSTGDLRLRRFLTLLASACVLLVVFAGTGDRWTVITSVPSDHAAAAWGLGFVVALMTVVAVVLAARFGRRWPALLLAGLIVGELLVLAPRDIYAERADPYRTPGWMPLVRTAQEGEPHSRVFGIDGKLYPNTAGALGLQDIRVLDALYVERYLRYVQSFIQPAFDRFTGDDEKPARFAGNPMFDTLGVRAVLSARDLASVSGFRFLGQDRGTRVYENLNAFPRAWVVRDVEIVRGEDEAFGLLEARARREDGVSIVDGFDPRREAVLERSGTSADEALRAVWEGRPACGAESPDRASIVRYATDSVTLRVRAACASLLVLSDTYFPGWKATVNGREREIYPTNGALRGVIVPKGTSRVEFRYEPRAFPLGLAVGFVGLGGFLVVGLVSRQRRRRRRTNPAKPACGPVGLRP